MQISISFIYVYYNSYKYISDSLKSLINNIQNIDYEIIIVINKMDDIENESLLKVDNRIKVLVMGNNIGFGRANNEGAKIARGKYVCITNPDVNFEDNSIKKMMDFMDLHKHFGLCGCKILEIDRSYQKNVFIKKYDIWFIIYQHYFLFKLPLIKNLLKKYFVLNDNEYEKRFQPNVISGALMFFRKSIYQKIGGFDEELFMYSEDVDISLRAKKESDVIYLPEAYILHHGDSTLGKIPTKFKLELIYQSLLFSATKQFTRTDNYILRILLFINALLFLPISKLFVNRTYRILLWNRSIVIIKTIINKRYNKDKIIKL